MKNGKEKEIESDEVFEFWERWGRKEKRQSKSDMSLSK